MQKYLPTFTFLFTIIYLPLTAQWQSLGTGIEASPRAIWGMAAPDTNTIWAFTWNEDDLTPTKEFTRSTDGGQTWQAGRVNTFPSSLYFNQVFAKDANEAWVTTSTIGAPLTGKVYHTTDGGETWEHQANGFNDDNEDTVVIHFFDDNNGIVIGNSFAKPMEQIVAYTTANGGELWTKANFPQLNSDEKIPNEVNTGLSAVVGNTIWVVSNSGRVFKSVNGGRSWTFSRPELDGDFFIPSLAMKDELNGILTIVGFNLGFRTKDGGETWESIDMPAPTIISNGLIEYVPGTAGTYMSKPTYFNPNNDAIITYNSGDTWHLVELDEKVNSLLFLSPTQSFGGGTFVNPDVGGIYRWQGEDLVSNAKEIVEDLRVTVFPNPVSDRFSLQYPSDFRPEAIKIMDSTGKLRYEKQGFNDSFSSEMDIKNWEAGVYHLQIFSGDRVVIKQLVKT